MSATLAWVGRVLGNAPRYNLVRAGRQALVGPLGLAALLSGVPALHAGEPPVPAAAKAATIPQVLQDLKSFATVATVLHVAAHPDDENTELITYIARGRGYRMAYLSLTRGDGGQNEIGPEFDEKLGLARTQELLAARKVDHGRQFFTRAIDFGFSKTPDETLAFWNRKEVLGDVVRIIRQFRPDVIVTRFPIPPGSGGHGHHTASGMLAVEAFKLAADPAAYPEQLQQGLTVWQAKRVVWNGFGGGRGGGGLSGPTFTMSIGGNDPVTGDRFAEIANRSRRKHVTQGLANVGVRALDEQTFMNLGGEPAKADLLDGVDTTWARVPGGTEIGVLAEKAAAEFKTDDPGASVPALLALRAKLASMAVGDPVVDDKRAQLDKVLVACLGLSVEAIAAQPEVVPGEKFSTRVTINVTGKSPVKWIETRTVYPRSTVAANRELRAGAANDAEVSIAVPADAPLTQPYWLRQEGSSGIARVDDPKLIGLPENNAAFPLEVIVEVGGQKLTLATEPVHVSKTGATERRRRVDVISPVSLGFAAEVSVFTPGASREVEVEVAAARAKTDGTVQLELPAGWSATPATQAFKLASVGDKAKVSFKVTAPARAASGRMTVAATVHGARYNTRRQTIDYPHLPLLLLQPPARARLVSVDVATKGKRVGYLPGAGDATAEALKQLGYEVTTLSGPDLKPEKLQGLDAVVIGVRAFNERSDLKANLPGLFAYVENGGTVIAQYNRPSGGLIEPLGPYSLSIAGPAPQLRVTDEKAPVTFLAPEHAALNSPNKIGPADFDGWVQERGAYFPSKWDEQRYTSIFALSDPGEAPLKSSVLVAQHGKGYYVYTGIAFFRQLPAGVPGAYRLFANLVSLGK